MVDIASLSHSHKGTNPTWPESTKLLISIYRDEDAKKRAADSYRPSTGASAPIPSGKKKANNSPLNRYRIDNDDDEGDFS